MQNPGIELVETTLHHEGSRLWKVNADECPEMAVFRLARFGIDQTQDPYRRVRMYPSGTIASGFPGAGYSRFTFGVDNGSGTFSGVLINQPSQSNPGNFTKEGTGTQILTGTKRLHGHHHHQRRRLANRQRHHRWLHLHQQQHREQCGPGL